MTATIKMFRPDGVQPVTADVHPDEVVNYAKGGWLVEDLGIDTVLGGEKPGSDPIGGESGGKSDGAGDLGNQVDGSDLSAKTGSDEMGLADATLEVDQGGAGQIDPAVDLGAGEVGADVVHGSAENPAGEFETDVSLAEEKATKPKKTK
jgi:hypothetical protein